ncbi:OmpA family protein [Corallococcus interemptor]|uniref:OmpA family protein n=1 Tax=Corallococcus interemptor TaxID=2316720 RepID=A0A3A8QRZ8_9BACT|nr:OmpA family protein [Corallococcus interemptor]RKH71539.1 OmpA family protein [Corallococcus interemptor]
MFARRHHLGLGGLAVLCAFSAQAQSTIPGIELERLQLNPGMRDSLVLSTGDLLPAGQFRVGLTAHYENRPLVLVEDDERQADIISNRVTTHISAAYSFTNWLEVGAQVPIVAQWGPETAGAGVTRPTTSALGTPWLQARVGFLSENGGGPLDLGLHLGAALPLGSKAALTRDEGFTFSPRLGAGKQLGGTFRVGADVGALVRTKTYALTPQTQPYLDEMGVELNGGVNLSAGLWGLREEVIVRGTIPTRDSPSSLEALLGLRVPTADGTEVYVLGGPGFGQTPGTPRFRILAGVSFGTPPAPKGPVCIAGQPHVAAECPGLDADGDGVKNSDDACPTTAGLAQLQGCPDKDDDQDGIPNLADKCPAQAENKNGFQDEDGCPDDPDSDGDGIVDSKDQCPKEPETFNRYKDQDGCPDVEPDRDGDGVVDRLDNCPDEPGTEANGGCKEAPVARIDTGSNSIRIMEAVFFENNKAVIQKRSNAVLDKVASILVSHPDIEKVRVEGHTDNTGKASYNLELSQKRAEAVVEYLVGKGVQRERLVAQGFGPTQPIADNAKADGRAKNRRVEFKIVGEAEGVQTAPASSSSPGTPSK